MAWKVESKAQHQKDGGLWRVEQGLRYNSGFLEGTPATDRWRIWNVDESSCFWKVLPNKGLAQKGKACHGGKVSKIRLTVAYFLLMNLEKKRKQLLHGNLQNLAVLRESTPVTYQCNILLRKRHGWLEKSCIHFYLDWTPASASSPAPFSCSWTMLGVTQRTWLKSTAT